MLSFLRTFGVLINTGCLVPITVNAWDCGNYVADYLIAKSGGETAGCSTKIVDYE